MSSEISSILMVEKFWESVPKAWYRTREVIRGIASVKHKLTVEQFQVLRRIRRGLTSVSTIANDSHRSRSAVSKIVDVLVKKGLIARNQNPNDRRNIPLELTSLGNQVMTSIYQEAEAWLSTRFEQMSSIERKSLEKGLDQLINIFSRD